jgi:hypothetical protein
MMRTALIAREKLGPESVPQEQSNSKHTVQALGGPLDLGTMIPHVFRRKIACLVF